MLSSLPRPIIVLISHSLQIHGARSSTVTSAMSSCSLYLSPFFFYFSRFFFLPLEATRIFSCPCGGWLQNVTFAWKVNQSEGLLSKARDQWNRGKVLVLLKWASTLEPFLFPPLRLAARPHSGHLSLWRAAKDFCSSGPVHLGCLFFPTARAKAAWNGEGEREGRNWSDLLELWVALWSNSTGSAVSAAGF